MIGGMMVGSDIGIQEAEEIASSLVFWVRADMGITFGTGVLVKEWADQSGTGDVNKHGVQLTVAQQPTYIPSDPLLNFNPSLKFSSASNSILQGGANWTTALAQPSTQFVVCYETAAATNMMAWGDQTTSGIGQGSVSNIWELWVNGSQTGDGTSKPVTAPTIVGGIFSGGCQIFVNQKTPQAAGGLTTTSLSKTYIGGAISGSSIFGNFNGNIAEIICYNKALSNAQIAQVMTDLGTRYNITLGA
jgi:hypothetical protein